MTLSRRGFTLLETLVAILIIAGAIVVITSAWSGNFMRIRKSALIQDVSHLIEKKMTELDIKYRDHFADITEEEHGDFGKEFKNYRWEMKSRDFEMPDIGALVASQSQKNGGGIDEMSLGLIRQMADYIKTAVKEVTLTVYAKSPLTKKEIPYTVTTYYVDYNKELSVPGMGGGPAPGPGPGPAPSPSPSPGPHP